MSDETTTANDLFFPPDVQFDDEETRVQAAQTFIYNVTEDLLVCVEDAGITRAELARRIEMNPSQLSRALSGAQNMTLKTVSDICHALGITPKLALDGVRSSVLVEPTPLAPDEASNDDNVWSLDGTGTIGNIRPVGANVLFGDFRPDPDAPVAA